MPAWLQISFNFISNSWIWYKIESIFSTLCLLLFVRLQYHRRHKRHFQANFSSLLFLIWKQILISIMLCKYLFKWDFSVWTQKSIKVIPKLNYCTFQKFQHKLWAEYRKLNQRMIFHFKPFHLTPVEGPRIHRNLHWEVQSLLQKNCFETFTFLLKVFLYRNSFYDGQCLCIFCCCLFLTVFFTAICVVIISLL